MLLPCGVLLLLTVAVLYSELLSAVPLLGGSCIMLPLLLNLRQK
jgi:hypothetical protein